MQSCKLDTRIFWIPFFCYFVWAFFLAYIKPRVVYRDLKERSEVERIRGWVYVLGFPVCFFFLYIFNFILPNYWSLTILGSLFGAFALVMAVAIIPKKLFKMEVDCMNKNQFDLFALMLKGAGSSLIFASIAILMLTEITIIGSYSSNFIIFSLILSVPSLIVSYYFNYKSSKYADNLSNSLKDSDWLKKVKTRKRR